ncbi:hypothetical protein B0H19DRAFT_1077705 [Mycena capillaripes]|nr:hypothetical protein B0H19DRAFT_1077705 [Mycena capillaripes]
MPPVLQSHGEGLDNHFRAFIASGGPKMEVINLHDQLGEVEEAMGAAENNKSYTCPTKPVIWDQLSHGCCRGKSVELMSNMSFWEPLNGSNGCSTNGLMYFDHSRADEEHVLQTGGLRQANISQINQSINFISESRQGFQIVQKEFRP